MLKVDLARLERERRLPIDDEVPAKDPLWENSGLTFSGPVRADLEAQLAGLDVIVQGAVTGALETTCRKCLTPLQVPMREEITAVFRPGLTQLEAEDQEVYALDEDEDELDLAIPVREQILLAAPQFVDCSEVCKGLCPRCGNNLNEAPCRCTDSAVEDRWAPLRQLKFE